MTSCKEAIKDIEVDGKVATEMEEVRLCPISNMKPLITKMDNALSTLKKCKHLRASTNAIEKIQCLNGMDSLQILSLGRNQIRKLEARMHPAPAPRRGGRESGAARPLRARLLARMARGLAPILPRGAPSGPMRAGIQHRSATALRPAADLSPAAAGP